MKTSTLLVTTWLLATPTAPRADDWPQWRGPDRTEISKEAGLLKKWPAGGPKLLWTYSDAGVGYSGPAVVGKFLYTMGARNDDKEYLFALNVETGKQEWATEIGSMLENDWGGGPRGTPTVEGDKIYAISGRGNLVCVNTAGGKKVWSVSLTSDLKGRTPNWGYAESPLIDGDHVICTPGSGGGMAALQKKDGKVVWQCKDLSDSAGYSSVIVAEVGGVKQYVQTTMSAVIGVRASDGKLLWRYEQRSYRTAVIPTPIFQNDMVYATAGYNAGCDLLKLTPDGQGTKATKVYSNKNMVNKHGGVVLVGDYIYGCSGDNRVTWVCQSFKTGEVKWSSNKLGMGSLTCIGDKLICYSERGGDVVLVDASPSGWKESGRFKIPKQSNIRSNRGGIWTHPVVANGKLYLRDQDLIFCYDVRARDASKQ